MRSIVLVLAACVLGAGCVDDSKGASDAGDAGGDAGDAGGDAGDRNTGFEDPLEACADLGLEPTVFVDAEQSAELLAQAADVTVKTMRGDFRLAERWSGCESFLFIQDTPRQNLGWPEPLWSRDVDALFELSPKNVHYLFVSTAKDQSVRDAALAALAAKVDEALAGMPAPDAAWWRNRVHYVTERASDMQGWLGEIMASPGWGCGVDRLQRVRYIGSYADDSRYDATQQWFAPNLSMAANEAIAYNFEAEREMRLAAENATVVTVLDNEAITGGSLAADANLPDATSMEGFDTMEFDLYLGCAGAGEYGTCPAWDTVASLMLCDADAPDVCTTEIGRWITTYHREGRWVHDASGLLPLFDAGGARRFVLAVQDGYEATLRIRLSSRGKPARPVQATPLFAGDATFDEVYNDAYDPVTVAIPADAVKVELATVITGHGMSMPGNCAEFCNTSHWFYVNGEPFVREFPQAGGARGCMDQVAEGTVPNQYGTWWYGRSGWCPGKHVEIVMIDVTDAILPGADNVFDYEGFYQMAPYTGDNWRDIRLGSWVVVSR